MRTYRSLIVILSMFAIAAAQAQLSIYLAPRERALIPRNLATNNGEARINGAVTQAGYYKLQYKIWQNGKLHQSYFQSLAYSSGSATFDLRPKLKAGKFRYKILLEIIGTDTLSRTWDDIVVGDVYIIQGQSNAVANAFNGLTQSTYGDSFIRSFGNSSYDPATSIADTFWYNARGDGFYNKGSIGQWGLVMAKHLVDSFGIPIAVLNGGVGGTSVFYHQRYDPEPDNPYTCYGRLLTRMVKAGLEKNVRGILWYQGESDGTRPEFHDSLFRILYADWFRDYKGMQKNYLVQVRGGGCGSPTLVMLELQRQFEFTLPKLQVVSSNGLNGHDGCHFALKNGYEQLGVQFAALMGRDLYGSSRKNHIDPPQISTARFSNSNFSEITLEFTKPTDSVFIDPDFYGLFSITGDNLVSIVGGSLRNNKVVLQLSQGSCKPLFLNYMGKAGVQSWVKNKLGMGLIGFYKIPVNKPLVKTAYFGCPKQIMIIGQDSVSGCKYNWLDLKTGITKTTAKIGKTLDQDLSFRLIIDYVGSGCTRDTFFVAVKMDKTPAPELGADTILCNRSVLNKQVAGIYAAVAWSQNGKKSNANIFETSDSGKIWLSVSSTQGCTYSDSMTVQTASPVVSIVSPRAVCSDSDSLVFADTGFSSYNWNGIVSNDHWFRSGVGSVALRATDHLGCVALDTAVIASWPVSKFPVTNYSLCPYDSVAFQKPVHVAHWEVNDHVTATSAMLYPGVTKVEWKDTFGCNYADSLVVKEKSLPIFTLGPDQFICSGKSASFTCSFTTSVYTWNGKLYSTPEFSMPDSGAVICAVRNIEGCSFQDTARVFLHTTPKFNVPSDTVLCKDIVWRPAFNPDFQMWLNGDETDEVSISLPGTYRIKAVNVFGCELEKITYVKFVNCTNRIEDGEINSLIIYPNPCNDILHLEMPGISVFYITNMQGSEVMTGTIHDNLDLDISALTAGLYNIRINGVVRKLLVY